MGASLGPIAESESPATLHPMAAVMDHLSAGQHLTVLTPSTSNDWLNAVDNASQCDTSLCHTPHRRDSESFSVPDTPTNTMRSILQRPSPERPNPQSHQRSSMEILQQASYRAVQSMRVGSHILTLNPRRRPPRAHQPPHRPSFLGFWSQKGHAKPGRLEHVALFLTAFTMTFDAGYLNAVCLAGIFRVTVSHTTGTITKIGLDIADVADGLTTSWPDFGVHSMLVVSYMVGSFICGLMIHNRKLAFGKHIYSWALWIISGMLFTVSVFPQVTEMKYICAMAAGLQNGLATQYSGAVVRTTHMTGIVTDIGLMLAQIVHKMLEHNIDAIAKDKSQRRNRYKLCILFILLFGFLSGSIAGGIAYARLKEASMYFVAFMTGVLGTVYHFYCNYYLSYQAAKAQDANNRRNVVCVDAAANASTFGSNVGDGVLDADLEHHVDIGVQDLAKCLSESRIVENDIAQSSSRMGECSEGEVDLD